MKTAPLYSIAVIASIAFALSNSSALATAAAAPAPLAGGGLAYLALGGSAAAVWLVVKAIAKKLNRRD